MSKFPFKVGDKVRYTGVDGWHSEGETLVVSFSEQPDGGHTWCVNDDYCLDIISVSWEDFELAKPAPEKHIHYDMILQWAANPSRVVEINCFVGGWEVEPNPTWREDEEYRFKPEEPERVSLSGVFPTTSLTDEELKDLFDNSNTFYAGAYRNIANAAIKRYILEQGADK